MELCNQLTVVGLTCLKRLVYILFTLTIITEEIVVKCRHIKGASRFLFFINIIFLLYNQK